MKRQALVLVVAVVIGFAQSASADLFRFDVVIDSTFSGTGSTATGTAVAFFETDTGEMQIDGSFSGLQGNATVAHLHGFADEGSGAGVLFGLSIDSATSGAFSGTGTITTDDASFTNTFGGRSYINIHSAAFGGGEIRGHLKNAVAVPEPSGLGLITLLCLSAACRRSRKA